MAELEIPEGWGLNTTVGEDGSEIKGFLCPETGQEFYTYHDLMRYVRYAKAAQLGIYAPDSEFNKAKQRDAGPSKRSSKRGKKNSPAGSLSSTEKVEQKWGSLSKLSSLKEKRKH